MPKDLVSEIDEIFRPRSVAVVGVSDKVNRLGNLLLYSFVDIGFEGMIYPINPKEETVMGFKSYPSIRDIEDPVDLVVVSVHPKHVPEIVDECVAKRVKAIVIFSAGYREKDEKGRRKEMELVEKARAGGVRIIGPNCMGLYCPSSKISFFPGMPKEMGEVAFLSQSGSLTNIMGFFAGLRGVRFSKMISVGNASDLDVNDFLEYLGSDPETKLIICYIEGVEDGRRFLKLAREISKRKPIIVWKVGETEGGDRAGRSHTGSLSGSREIWDAVIKQTGLIRVENHIELVGFITAFQNPYLPGGNRVVVMSGPGGPAVSTADACEKAGLKLVKLSEETEKKLAEIIPEFGTSASNPVDLSLSSSFDVEMYPRATEICGLDENVDMLVEVIPAMNREVIERLIEVQKNVRKPIAVITSLEFAIARSSLSKFFGVISPEELTQILMKMYQSGISVHSSEQEAAKALVALLNYKKYLEKAE
ncbi:MAG: acetate--CoA ligase family protein [Candidatus Jordarchaeum sp.]|uniref:acetate--CoA ligase family protein n=1 Tax=Candidatus Jordarchaeum sp. TaxID=2823881 RepID=UPI00404A4EF8